MRAAGTREAPLVTKWCYNHTDPATQPPVQPVFGEKLIKKDRKPKSNKFKHKNIPSGLVISRNPLVVPEIHNEVIDDVPANEDVNDRKKPKKPSIFGDKLISQNLLPPKFQDDQDRSARKIIKTYPLEGKPNYQFDEKLSTNYQFGGKLSNKYQIVGKFFTYNHFGGQFFETIFGNHFLKPFLGTIF